uniref:Uncharacterized protein n=1 Tax=Meloidogyne enterolobii TaxID=390850 RepID=A0A6V7VLX7_MELEN|nr:unnamed protein product [Meloidogyne enterolobii]
MSINVKHIYEVYRRYLFFHVDVLKILRILCFRNFHGFFHFVLRYEKTGLLLIFYHQIVKALLGIFGSILFHFLFFFYLEHR